MTCGAVACASVKGVKATGQLSEHTIDVDGLERTFLLYTPGAASPVPETRPLVIVFHGGGGTARGTAREVGRSLHGIADRAGFVIAYPHAIGKVWDFGEGLISEALETRVDDRAYFLALLDELVRTLPIDQQRIFATGISRGGQASYFIACNFPDRIRAIAPVAMPMPKFMLDLCSSVPATGLAILNGTDDPLVPYDGGQITVGRRQRGEVMSTDETIAYWRQRNGCNAIPSSEQVLDPAKDGTTVIRIEWSTCEHDPVLLYRIEGGGHTWPSGRQYLPRFMIGRVTRDINGPSEIWSFFSRY